MPVYRSDDPVADFERYDAEQQRRLSELPVCSECGEPVQDDFYYEINDEIICQECLDRDFRKRTEDYIA